MSRASAVRRCRLAISGVIIVQANYSSPVQGNLPGDVTREISVSEPMGDLIEAIRRRSVWQVLAIYVGGAFVALQAVEQVVESAGLPDWVRAYSLVLLILFLPIVMVTAAIQGRASSRSEESKGEVGESPTETSASARPRGGSRRWFTWRNAAITGIGGFLILAVATAGYLILRASGIGPAGTLKAQGTIEEGATVVLADFESADPDLASVLTNTLRTDLLQSPFLNVLEPSELAEGLARMELETDATITPEIAREIAIRESFDAVIEGEVGPVGDGYVLTARIVGGDDWTSLAAFRSTARSDDDLIDAIEDLSRDIRDKSGESLRSARSGPPLRAVTTSSLEALKAYNRGIEFFLAGDRAEAITWYERAIEVDPEFAMAYRRLAAMLNDRRNDQIAAGTRAYELRHRLTEMERLLAEAYYYSSVVDDYPAAERTYQRMIDLAPDADITRNARNNLAVIYVNTGRYGEAEQLMTDLVAEGPSQTGVNSLANIRIALGDIDGAWAALEDGSGALPETAYHFANRRVSLAVALDDIPLARDLAAAFAERYPGPRDLWRRSNHVYLIKANEGRLEEAAGAIEGRTTHPVARAQRRAFLRATRGDSAGAVRVLLEGWGASLGVDAPIDRLYGLLLPELIRFGGRTQAEEIFAEWRREIPTELLGFPGRVRRLEVEGELALASGRIDEAVLKWESYEELCPPCSETASYGLGRAHEAVGDKVRAIAEYERTLETWHQYDRDPFFRTDAFRRLARLHEEAGNPDEAASYYRRISERWHEADASLQPQVRSARAALEGPR